MDEINKRLCDTVAEIRKMHCNHFVASHALQAHPIIRTKPQLRTMYYLALEYFVDQCSVNKEYTNARLTQYRAILTVADTIALDIGKNQDHIIRSIVNNSIKPWRKKYRYWLLCDIALILVNEHVVRAAYNLLQNYLSRRQILSLDKLFDILVTDDTIPPALTFAGEMIEQYRANRRFAKQTEKRFLVTATMSAGKSTLINAIIGKTIAKTSQVACTSNLAYFYNKPLEDGNIHLYTSTLNLSATYYDFSDIDKDDISKVASYFRSAGKSQHRICLIDTPGVDAALMRNHGRLARKAITEESFDKLIYVLNANSIGADKEIKHLEYVYKNVPNEKIVFVINKLDDFNSTRDSIAESIGSVIAVLEGIGFEEPVVCPVSASLALLAKLKQYGERLSEDDEDWLLHCAKKFSKPEYDLSVYYHNEPSHKKLICCNFGMCGLENILYGGQAREESIHQVQPLQA